MITRRDMMMLAIGGIQLALIAVAGWYLYREVGSEARSGVEAPLVHPECIGHLEGRPVCEVTGSDLFSASGRMDSRLIRITGYLAVDRGVVSLYPSEADYLLGINNHALVLRAPLDEQRRLVDNFGYGYVRLIGVYRTRDEGSTRMGKVGALHVERDEAVPKRGDREGSDKILINIEDLESTRAMQR